MRSTSHFILHSMCKHVHAYLDQLLISQLTNLRALHFFAVLAPPWRQYLFPCKPPIHVHAAP
jgi:hypothetical protein